MHCISAWSLGQEVSSFSPLPLPLFQILYAVLPEQEKSSWSSEFQRLLLPNVPPSTLQTLAQRAAMYLALLPSAAHSAPCSTIDGSGSFSKQGSLQVWLCHKVFYLCSTWDFSGSLILHQMRVSRCFALAPVWPTVCSRPQTDTLFYLNPIICFSSFQKHIQSLIMGQSEVKKS